MSCHVIAKLIPRSVSLSRNQYTSSQGKVQLHTLFLEGFELIADRMYLQDLVYLLQQQFAIDHMRLQLDDDLIHTVISKTFQFSRPAK